MSKIHKIQIGVNFVFIRKNIPYRLPINSPYGYIITIGLSEVLTVDRGTVIVAKGRKLDNIINGEVIIIGKNLLSFCRTKDGWFTV